MAGAFRRGAAVAGVVSPPQPPPPNTPSPSRTIRRPHRSETGCLVRLLEGHPTRGPHGCMNGAARNFSGTVPDSARKTRPGYWPSHKITKCTGKPSQKWRYCEGGGVKLTVLLYEENVRLTAICSKLQPLNKDKSTDNVKFAFNVRYFNHAILHIATNINSMTP